jgi:hypothetical protein
MIWLVALALLAGGGYVGLRHVGVLPGGPLFGVAPPEVATGAVGTEGTQPVAIAPEAPAPAVVDAGSEAEATAEALPAEPVQMVEVRVESNPRGAEILVGDAVLGTTPAEVELPLGQAVALRIKAPRHVEETVELTPEEHNRTVRVTLAELPYVVSIESTPSGAHARIWGQTTTTPGEITLSSPPSNIVLRVSTSGYQSEVRNLPRAEFTETEDAMRQVVEVTLERGRTPTPAPRRDDEPAGAEPSSAAPSPSAPASPEAPSETAPAAPAPEAPAPAAEPAPASSSLPAL